MELEEIRKKLDKIDNQIVLLLSKRLSFMPHLAKYKLENNIERYQPDREKIILKAKVKLGKKHNLRSEYVQDIFKRIIEESHVIQRKIIKD